MNCIRHKFPGLPKIIRARAPSHSARTINQTGCSYWEMRIAMFSRWELHVWNQLFLIRFFFRSHFYSYINCCWFTYLIIMSTIGVITYKWLFNLVILNFMSYFQNFILFFVEHCSVYNCSICWVEFLLFFSGTWTYFEMYFFFKE